jgi:hypothetical protein
MRFITLAALAVLTTPMVANATLQFTAYNNGVQSFAQDQNFGPIAPATIADGDPSLNSLLLGNGSFVNVGGGILVSGSLHSATQGTGLTQELDSASLKVVNTNGSAVTATVAISATGFTGPVTAFAASGSGTFQNAVGGTMINRWYDDPLNAQGAQPNTCAPGNTCGSPGDLLAVSAPFADTGSPNSYAFDFAGPVNDTGPFSMTLQFEFTLPAATASGCLNGTDLNTCPSLTSRGQALQKTNAPEPASLALIGAGMMGLGLVRGRRGRRE